MTDTPRPNPATTREDVVAFLRNLCDSLETSPEEWENPTLSSYLDAMAAWIDDMDGYYANRGEAPPTDLTWGILRDILSAAKVYE